MKVALYGIVAKSLRALHSMSVRPAEKALVPKLGRSAPGQNANRACGNPTAAPGWQWSCGFYPGSDLADHARGIAETFDQARGAFEAAWRVFLARRTEADFEENRRDRAFHVWKQATWATDLGACCHT
jgi:hypothetical protein